MKVLIIDDEVSIREWMAYIISKMAFDFEKILTASNGEDAVILYDREKPDIIFVDLFMPKMDGMEFIEYVRKRNKIAELIILTSHSDFEFARRALKQGIRDYILKPEINREKLWEIMDNIKCRIETRKKLDDGNLDFSSMKKNAFVREVVCASEKISVTRDLLDEYAISLEDRPLFALAFRPANKTERFDIAIPGNEFVGHVTGLVYDKYTHVLVCNIRRQVSTLEQIYNINEFTAKILRKNNFNIGVSRVYPGIEETAFSIKESVFRLDMLFYGERNADIFSESAEGTTKLWQLLNKYQGKFKQEGEHSSSLELFKALLDELFLLRSCDITTMKENLVSLLYSIVSKNFTASGECQKAFLQVKEQVILSDSFKSMSSAIEEYLMDFEMNKTVLGQKYSRSVNLAIKYINENILSPLPLKLVSDYVYLNPDYFSRLFKKETGENFVSYVENEKMKKAASLLRETDMKVYEVAQALGYKNVSYFSALFKKKFGVNPFSYKNYL